MPLTLEHPDSELPAVGSRTIRTIFRADGTAHAVYTAVSTDGINHEGEFENTAAIAWISNAIANPGTNADIDALKQANPNWTAADLAPSAAALRIYGDQVALGFTNT